MFDLQFLSPPCRSSVVWYVSVARHGGAPERSMSRHDGTGRENRTIRARMRETPGRHPRCPQARRLPRLAARRTAAA
jgi:hypothetical protein